VPALMAQVGAVASDERVRELLTKIAAGPEAKVSGALRTLGKAVRSVNGAVELLAYRPDNANPVDLHPLIEPRQPAELQLAAVRSLAARLNGKEAERLLLAWPAAGPAVRREIQEALFAHADRLPALLDAIAKKTVLPQQLDAARIAQLRAHRVVALRTRAEKLLANALDADRQKIIERFRDALELKADAAKGRAVFKKVCATCHRLEDIGTEVGPDLRTALRDKTAEQLLISILDPSREVDRRFTNYVVETTAGRSLSGMIASESATSILLRRAEKAEDSVLRVQIESMRDTAKSLMPDALEQQLTKQELADVIAYLRGIK